MFRSLFGDGPALRLSRRSTGEPPPARFRPQVEALEDRTLAAFGASLAVSATTVTAGQPITLTASLLPGALDRLNSVTFLDGTRVLGQKTGDLVYANHQLTVVLGVGTHSLTVRMEGMDGIPIPAAPFTVTSSAVAVQVNPAPVPVTPIKPAPGADVTSQLRLDGQAAGGRFKTLKSRKLKKRHVGTFTLTNIGVDIQGSILIRVSGLRKKVKLVGIPGDPIAPDGVLASGETATLTFRFRTPLATARPVSFTPSFVVG